jgi:hypothetical protein
VFAAIDKAFATCPRPAKFTDHPYCEECADAQSFFERQNLETLGAMVFESESVPVAFLTEPAFLHFFPALARMMTRGDIVGLLQMTEGKLHLFNAKQKSALRDFLYELEPGSEWMAAETVERIVGRLESDAAYTG